MLWETDTISLRFDNVKTVGEWLKGGADTKHYGLSYQPEKGEEEGEVGGRRE